MREVVVPWECQRSGDCCSSVSQIVFSKEEAKLAGQNTPLSLTFYTHPDKRFVYLAGKPCPLLSRDSNGRATCTIHSVRPYNCRRFMCGRPDPSTEPYESEPLDVDNGRLGCANLSDRLADRKFRRFYAQMQRKAQRWALKHGWSEDLVPSQAGSNVTFYRLG